MSHTYKNKTDKELVLPNIGVVPANADFTSSFTIENPNIESTEAPAEQPATDTNNEEATT